MNTSMSKNTSVFTFIPPSTLDADKARHNHGDGQ